MPGGKRPSITLIFMAFNEEATLEGVLREALEYCRERLETWEILVVDDGSRDGSPEIAARVAGEESGLSVIIHEENRGMGAAMATGIAHAQCEYLMFLSSDGQAPVTALERFFPALETADIVVSIYEDKRELERRLLSFGLRAYMRLWVGIRFQLEGLYLFPTKLAKELGPEIRAQTFFFSFELIDRAQKAGYRLATVSMEYKTRREGQSKVASWSRTLRVGREVLDYRRRKAEESDG